MYLHETIIYKSQVHHARLRAMYIQLENYISFFTSIFYSTIYVFIYNSQLEGVSW